MTGIHCRTCACPDIKQPHLFIPKDVRYEVIDLYTHPRGRRFYSPELGLSIYYEWSICNYPEENKYLRLSSVEFSVDRKRSPKIIKQLDALRGLSWDEFIGDTLIDGIKTYNFILEKDKQYILSCQKKIDKVLNKIRKIKKNTSALEVTELHEIVRDICANRKG